MSGVAFKFFIPDETYEVLRANAMVRLDRFHNVAVQVDWTEEKLRQLLQRRLDVFSNGRVTDFAQICQEQDKQLAARLEQKLLAVADNSPRRLITAVYYLMEAHVQNVGPTGLIGEGDWDKADEQMRIDGFIEGNRENLVYRPIEQPGREIKEVTEITDAIIPILYIHPELPQILIAAEKIDLTPTEHSIMLEIEQNDNMMSRDDLARIVWQADKDTSNQAIDRTISRLRDKLKPVSNNDKYRYIKTVRGWGYRLENCELDYQHPLND